MNIGLLAGLFFAAALLYASVGFGGGSTYTALLIISGTDFRIIPVIALICNILVVSGNSVRYARQGHLNVKALWPFIILSVPAAWIGGRLEISQTLFIGLLWGALFFAGTRLLLTKRYSAHQARAKYTPALLKMGIGAAIGFYSGLVGIGGGIFLSPILHFLRWGSAKQIAALCSVFILLNSASGLWGHLAKLSAATQVSEVIAYWPVIPAVLLGGFIGNYIGVFKLSEHVIKRLTGLLILIVAFRLLARWVGLVF